MYLFLVKEESKRDLFNFFILPFLLWRMLHNQIWISISRYRTAKGNNLLVDKSLQFEQVDREQNWSVLFIHINIKLMFIYIKMGMDWILCSSALDPLRCGHVIKIGHVLRSQQIQCTGTLDSIQVHKN